LKLWGKETKKVMNRKMWQNVLRMIMGSKGSLVDVDDDDDNDDSAGDSSQSCHYV
jgi:hypothetical protein